VTTDEQIAEHLQHVDGVMVGREAYHNPWSLAAGTRAFFGQAPSMRTPDEVEAAMVDLHGARGGG
jgi:tRNA-dihydrouridine synthase A